MTKKRSSCLFGVLGLSLLATVSTAAADVLPPLTFLLAVGAPVLAPVAQGPGTMAQGLGILEVRSFPTGAQVSVRPRRARRGQEQHGTTPCALPLPAGNYVLRINKQFHNRVQQAVSVDEGRMTVVDVQLRENLRLYPSSPMRIMGKVLVFSGLGLVGVGMIATLASRSRGLDYENSLEPSALSDSRWYAGMMWVSYGVGAAAIASGAVLWVKAPSAKEYWLQRHGAGLAPTADGHGAGLTLSGRF